MSFSELTVNDIRDSIARGETSARVAAESSLDAAEKLNDSLNAFLEIDRDGAVNRADEIDSKIASQKAAGEKSALPALSGVPIAIKDNICVRGMQTSCGSRILGPYHPPYNATAIERLLDAGANIIGKTNFDEFAMGSSNENSAFGPVKNPWDTSRVPGGSSGGSAAVVAAGIVPVALGSDTGGSGRPPGLLWGVGGLKTADGRGSTFGRVAVCSSLDQIGVFARHVRDVATVLGVIAGRDEHDATTAEVSVPDYTADLTGDVKGLRIGFPRALF